MDEEIFDCMTDFYRNSFKSKLTEKVLSIHVVTDKKELIIVPDENYNLSIITTVAKTANGLPFNENEHKFEITGHFNKTITIRY